MNAPVIHAIVDNVKIISTVTNAIVVVLVTLVLGAIQVSTVRANTPKFMLLVSVCLSEVFVF